MQTILFYETFLKLILFWILLSSSWRWFQICFLFTPKIGEDEPMLTNIFQRD